MSKEETIPIKRYWALPTAFDEVSNAQLTKKKWGTEHLIDNGLYCVKIMSVLYDGVCSIHMHRKKKETFVLVSGQLEVTTVNTDTGEHTVTILENIGDSITIYPETYHSFRAKKYYYLPVVFVEASTYDDPEDNIRVTQSKGPEDE